MPDRERLLNVAKAVGLVLALGVGATLVLHAASAGIPFWYGIAMAAVLVSLVVLARSTWSDGVRPCPPDFGPGLWRPRTVAMLAPIERRLVNATRDKRLYTNRLRPLLYDIARERVERHGGPDLGGLDDLGRSPEARTILGEELWQWLSDQNPDGRAPSPATVQRLVSAIEGL